MLVGTSPSPSRASTRARRGLVEQWRNLLGRRRRTVARRGAGGGRVVAVHSFVQGTCARGGAYSARVTSRLAWIEAGSWAPRSRVPCVPRNGTSGERTCGKLERVPRGRACARYASCMGSCRDGARAERVLRARAPAGGEVRARVRVLRGALRRGLRRRALGLRGRSGVRQAVRQSLRGLRRACCGALAVLRGRGCHACVVRHRGPKAASRRAKRTLDACVRASRACVLARTPGPRGGRRPTTAAVDVGAGADGGAPTRAAASRASRRHAGRAVGVVAWLVVRAQAPAGS